MKEKIIKKLKELNKTALAVSIFSIFIFVATPLYDKKTDAYLNTSLKQAAVTYAVTRGINAAVSIIQESSLTVGVGVEGTFALGQALDPINDATERFSDLLTLMLWTLGSEKIIYELSKTDIFLYLVILLAIMNILYSSAFLRNLLLILAILRLFLPFSVLMSQYFEKNYFEPKIMQNIQTLKPFAAQPKPAEKKQSGLWDKISETFSQTKETFLEIENKAKYYISNSDKIIGALLNLASIYLTEFLLKVILLPLLLVYIIKNLNRLKLE